MASISDHVYPIGGDADICEAFISLINRWRSNLEFIKEGEAVADLFRGLALLLLLELRDLFFLSFPFFWCVFVLNDSKV